MTRTSGADPDWTGSLLAGGHSRRMGYRKVELRLPDGRRLLDLPAAALRETCGCCLFLPGRQGLSTPQGFRAIPDGKPDAGPLAALVAALEAMAGNWLLVCAADMPHLTPDLLRELQCAAREDPERALIPHSANGLQPLAACYPRRLAGLLRSAMEDGEASVHRALPLEARRIRNYAGEASIVKLRDPFLNLNTVQDWERFLQTLS